VTAVAGEPPSGTLQLLGARPNPFRQNTTLRFRLPEAARVQLDVYDVQGRMRLRQDLGVLDAGDQSYSFSGKGLGTGLYLYRLQMVNARTGLTGGALNGR
jgi:hypothetical protein